MLAVGAVEPKRKVRAQLKKRKKRVKPLKSVKVDKIVGFIHKITPRYCDLRLLVPVLGLVLFGVLMIYSASNYNAKIYYDDSFYYTVKQLIGLVLGLVGMLAMYFIDYHWLCE